MLKMISASKYFGPDIKTTLAQKHLDGDSQLWQSHLGQTRSSDVEKALATPAGVYNFKKLIALISPAAENYLEQMAQLAHQLTVQRFGKTIKLYVPLYLSNYCVNSCLYCGFNRKTKFQRTRLTVQQAVAEAQILSAKEFTDILLVSSEDRKFINIDYLIELSGRLRTKFSFISAEIYPLNSDEYTRLFKAGIEGITLYQETYNRGAYTYYHPAGPKSDYDNRLNAPDSIASAGMREIGLGVLLGLSDWRAETLALVEHAHYLIKRHWCSHISFSFPRLRPAYKVGGSQFKHLLSSKNLVQMITALRLCFPDAGLVLSTRENAQLRDWLIKLGITRISAGSKTNPGGYSGLCNAIEQFEINDNRSPSQVADMIKAQDLEPVWKDWDTAFIKD